MIFLKLIRLLGFRINHASIFPCFDFVLSNSSTLYQMRRLFYMKNRSEWLFPFFTSALTWRHWQKKKSVSSKEGWIGVYYARPVPIPTAILGWQGKYQFLKRFQIKVEFKSRKNDFSVITPSRTNLKISF